MKKLSAVTAIALVVVIVSACRMIETLSNSPSAGTVSSLWSDVPPLEGATKADLEIPLGARLLIRAALQGQMSFIAFKTTKSAQEVQDFYNKERMKAAGWTPSDKGCIADSEDQKSQGAVCLFSRKNGDKQNGLAIVMAHDDKTKETEIFYVRVEVPEPSPSPSRR
jgi:hypothetical protein